MSTNQTKNVRNVFLWHFHSKISVHHYFGYQHFFPGETLKNTLCVTMFVFNFFASLSLSNSPSFLYIWDTFYYDSVFIVAGTLFILPVHLEGSSSKSLFFCGCMVRRSPICLCETMLSTECQQFCLEVWIFPSPLRYKYCQSFQNFYVVNACLTQGHKQEIS